MDFNFIKLGKIELICKSKKLCFIVVGVSIFLAVFLFFENRSNTHKEIQRAKKDNSSNIIKNVVGSRNVVIQKNN